MDRLNVELLINLLMSQQKINTNIVNHLKKHKLNFSEYSVLEYIHDTGAQPVQKIAAHVKLTSGTMTYIIDKLEKKKMVIRNRDLNDKRKFIIELTDNGKEFVNEFLPHHEEFVDKIFKNLSNEEKTDLISKLGKLIDNIVKPVDNH